MNEKQNPWPAALETLRGQMTEKTFNTWLKGTTATQHNDEIITVQVKDHYATQWLESRLQKTIDRAVAAVVGHNKTKVYFEVETEKPEPEPRPDEPGPGEFIVDLISFDPAHWGNVTTQRYAMVFWQPSIGGLQFQVWVTLRAFAWNNADEGWPAIQTLADICANGNRHRIIGRNERIDRAAQIGALEKLSMARIIHARTQGKGRKTQYFFRVLDNLPLLTPHQVEELTPELQERHKRWLWRCSIDYEEWEQLNFKSLLDKEE